MCACVNILNKNKCYKQTSQTKESKKSKTFEVMEFWKRNFDKLKPTALSQTQKICVAHNQRWMQKKRRSLSQATEKSLCEQRTKSNHKTKKQATKLN